MLSATRLCNFSRRFFYICLSSGRKTFFFGNFPSTRFVFLIATPASRLVFPNEALQAMTSSSRLLYSRSAHHHRAKVIAPPSSKWLWGILRPSTARLYEHVTNDWEEDRGLPSRGLTQLVSQGQMHHRNWHYIGSAGWRRGPLSALPSRSSRTKIALRAGRHAQRPDAAHRACQSMW